MLKNEFHSLTNALATHFLMANTLKSKFAEVDVMKNVHGVIETAPALDRSITAATGGRSVLATEKKLQVHHLRNFHLTLNIFEKQLKELIMI